MKNVFMSLALMAVTSSVAFAQTPAANPTQTYIDAGFAAMDADRNGQVDRGEFDRFMRARLAKQQASFESAFAKLDKNADGGISEAESAALPPIAENFAVIDTDRNGSIDKDELRSAMLAAQAQQGAAQ